MIGTSGFKIPNLQQAEPSVVNYLLANFMPFSKTELWWFSLPLLYVILQIQYELYHQNPSNLILDTALYPLDTSINYCSSEDLP